MVYLAAPTTSASQPTFDNPWVAAIGLPSPYKRYQGLPSTLPLGSEDFPDRSISPILEIGAYEALWLEKGASFKRIAEKMQASHGARLSDLVPPGIAQQKADEALQLIWDAGLESLNVRIYGAGEYPPNLRDAQYPLELFYYRGWWDLVNAPSVAIVGSRKASDDGIRRARRIARMLVKDDFSVVSGLAKGIDTAAHTAAIESGGRTIAVIGTSIEQCYPKENRELQEQIAKDFLLISQIPIIRYNQQSWRGNRFFFPERNITMSALTKATIIVEAGNTSGTLTQARAALAQGRKLFILDSCFQNPELHWPHKFQELGAIRVSEYEDIQRVLLS